MKKCINVFAQYIDRGYTLEPTRRGGSNEYTQTMFWAKNKKKYIPAYPSLTIRNRAEGGSSRKHVREMYTLLNPTFI